MVTIKTMVRGFQNATRGRTYTMSNRAGDEYVLFDRQDKFFGKDVGQQWLLDCQYYNVVSKQYGRQRECKANTVVFKPMPALASDPLVASLSVDADSTIPWKPP